MTVFTNHINLIKALIGNEIATLGKAKTGVRHFMISQT